MMKCVLLRLEGPMQSWGTQSRFEERDTGTEPSKSGVLGLVGAALGMPRDDQSMLAKLAALTMAVRVDREGTMLRDYHTAGGGQWPGRAYGVADAKGKLQGTVVSQRYYLADASFLVALCGDDEDLLSRIEHALQHPVWGLFLGRKAFPPSAPVYVPGGLRGGTLEEVLSAEPWQPPPGLTPKNWPMQLRVVLECDSPEIGQPRNDLPLSFGMYERRFARRYVRTIWIPRPAKLEETCTSPVSG